MYRFRDCQPDKCSWEQTCVRGYTQCQDSGSGDPSNNADDGDNGGGNEGMDTSTKVILGIIITMFIVVGGYFLSRK